MRLYRGLQKPYRADYEKPSANGIDCTDCPYTALQYASTRRGAVIVLDTVEGMDQPHVTAEFWLVARSKRFMVWGVFDRLITDILPAKELRTRIRQKGMLNLPDSDKGKILNWYIRERLASEQRAPLQPRY